MKTIRYEDEFKTAYLSMETIARFMNLLYKLDLSKVPTCEYLIRIKEYSLR